MVRSMPERLLAGRMLPAGTLIAMETKKHLKSLYSTASLLFSDEELRHTIKQKIIHGNVSICPYQSITWEYHMISINKSSENSPTGTPLDLFEGAPCCCQYTATKDWSCETTGNQWSVQFLAPDNPSILPWPWQQSGPVRSSKYLWFHDFIQDNHVHENTNSFNLGPAHKEPGCIFNLEKGWSCDTRHWTSLNHFLQVVF